MLFVLIFVADQDAIVTLLDLAERYTGHGRELANQSAGTVKGAHQDGALQRTERNIKVCLKLYHTSLPILIQVDTDREIRQFHLHR